MPMRILALFLVLTFAFPLLADPPMTTLRVEVKTYSDKPIDRASVIVRFIQGFSPIKMKKVRTTWEMRTAQDGVAKMPSLPQGKIQIQVIAKGYQTFGQTYEINEAERTIEVKLNAPQPQVSAHQ
ncbi:MAG: carboxypeptidase regulatory-like domain-containing protein [Candidatus Solibacter usitatus]|nr:carboxypeptidase regulatory-like domain-containing protein [Candidatus Solibacter usitatus]